MNERRANTPEEREAALREALARIRPQIIANPARRPVSERVGAIAARPDEPVTSNVKAKPKKSMGLAEMGRMTRSLDERARREGIEISRPTNEKNEKEKNKEKDKDKDKKNTPEKQEEKMRKMFAKVKLPSGMELHQEGPQWVLISRDGRQRTDVTDVMNTIDNFNHNVDAANEQNRMQNAAQSSVDNAAGINKKNEGLTVSETSDRVQMIGQALPTVKDANGAQLFKPEDIRAIAETAVNFSNEKALLEKLRDPRALEEMRKRERRNEQNAEALRRQQIDNALNNSR